jgi:hypothetical protein
LHNFDLRARHRGFDTRFDLLEEFHLPLRVTFQLCLSINGG